jgi:hypothetical protein
MRLAGSRGKARRGPSAKRCGDPAGLDFADDVSRRINRTAAKSRYVHKNWIPIFSTPPMRIAAGASDRKSVRP